MRGLPFFCALLAASGAARADVLAIANAVRAQGCAAGPGMRSPLRGERRLDQAARRLAHGERLTEALRATGYRALASASIHIHGNVADSAARSTLAAQFCGPLLNAAFREIGSYRSGDDLWIIAASPFETPRLTDSGAVARQVLESANFARSHGHRCGERLFAPAAPLRPSQQLLQAARAHSDDMAAHGYLDHVGRDRSTPSERVTRTGYHWRVVGENVAGGPVSAEEAANGWLASPEHCANIMDPRFTEMAVAYSINPASTEGVYWTELFASPGVQPQREGSDPGTKDSAGLPVRE